MKKIIPTISLLLLMACTPREVESSSLNRATESPMQSSTASAVASPTSAEKEAPDPQLDAIDCAQNKGSMEHYDLESDFLDAGLQFRVYLPPCYQEQENRNFPVLYLIHGQTFNDDQWDRLGADEAAEALIASGESAAFLIVMPFDLSSAQPSIDPFAEAFIQELIPYIDEQFRTIDEAEFRAIGGLSRGASWAFHFALTAPELFSAVGGHSPPIFVEDAPQVRTWLQEIPAEVLPRIWLDIGEKDQQAILTSALWFEEMLTELSIPHEWHLFPGNHDEAYWSSHVEQYLRWYSQNW